MAELDAASRKRIKRKNFGLRSERKYPMHDRSHAANAKARATQQYKKGNLSREERDRIHRRADKKLGD